MNMDLVIFGLGVVVTIIGCGLGLIWSVVREESKSQAEQLALKADKEALAEVENRAIIAIHELKLAWRNDLSEIKTNTAKMVEVLESRHNTQLEAVSRSLGVQIEKSETNITSKINLMMELVKAKVR